MLRRFIQSAEALPPQGEFSPEERKALRSNFPGLAARRMSALPLMLGQVTRNTSIAPEDALFFASEFGGAQALEPFLSSFPMASPIGFQNSTQPGAASLVLVARKQPVSGFTPVTGGPETVERALLLTLCSSNQRVHLWGGEEKGTWMTGEGLAAASNFAFCLELSTFEARALGTVTFNTDPVENAVSSPSTEAFTHSILNRRPLCIASASGGIIDISWQ